MKEIVKDVKSNVEIAYPEYYLIKLLTNYNRKTFRTRTQVN